jgi:response regulator RpfG family c-di-GMP phosphodiesterase
VLILGEVAFVSVLLGGYILRLIHSFSSNFKLYLSNQAHGLARVTSGALDTRIPVTSNDEFGVIATDTNHMIKSLESKTRALGQAHDVAIRGLASLAETRDNETGAHILRTQYYVQALAEYLKEFPDFSDELTDDNIDMIFKSAPLHDVGKVGIPDAILLKPGKLTDEEFDVMRGHPDIGAKALAQAERYYSQDDTRFLHYAKEIALCHHEKWDGTGYPSGLVGAQIPISARLMALADVYDALISPRVYKPAFSHEKALDIILSGRATHFDPDVVDAFLALEGRFVEIAARYRERPEVVADAEMAPV